MYHEIQKLSRDGLNTSQIADYLGLNWRTVKKQLEMDEREFESYLENNENRPPANEPRFGPVRCRLEQRGVENATQPAS